MEEGISAGIELEDGAYTIAVELSGGTGRAAITSPAEMVVKDGTAYAHIEWSSSSYDYMIVDGEKYLPVNEEGHSAFEIPVFVFDEQMTVIADTTAMSVPHEIEYHLIFHSDGIVYRDQFLRQTVRGMTFMAVLIAAACIFCMVVFKKRRKSKK